MKPMTVEEYTATLKACGWILNEPPLGLDSVIAFFVATADVAAHTYLGEPR